MPLPIAPLEQSPPVMTNANGEFIILVNLKMFLHISMFHHEFKELQTPVNCSRINSHIVITCYYSLCCCSLFTHVMNLPLFECYLVAAILLNKKPANLLFKHCGSLSSVELFELKVLLYKSIIDLRIFDITIIIMVSKYFKVDTTNLNTQEIMLLETLLYSIIHLRLDKNVRQDLLNTIRF
ncbi:hypothetical protein NQ315_004854 [Exocentrus adspersus]|uniref:Cyclin N-terminal domain-containing protein n=1 Tax=Exocentrus adspersus TaxID=1586481 RepID=A0AAV8W312_9CUCU|nr:hypothetical protein NQ315_004854 [Exocentrus adspersus]